MVKYCGHYITFQEVPNEVALTFTISNCPYHCPGCHSPWLQQDIGDELTKDVILSYLDKYQGVITCVCLMGDGNDYVAIRSIVQMVRSFGLKTCVYTGGHRNDVELYDFPDYFKEGAYIEKLGGLSSSSTNQRMWKLNDKMKYEDITSWFWRKKE